MNITELRYKEIYLKESEKLIDAINNNKKIVFDNYNKVIKQNNINNVRHFIITLFNVFDVKPISIYITKSKRWGGYFKTNYNVLNKKIFGTCIRINLNHEDNYGLALSCLHELCHYLVYCIYIKHNAFDINEYKQINGHSLPFQILFKGLSKRFHYEICSYTKCDFDIDIKALQMEIEETEEKETAKTETIATQRTFALQSAIQLNLF